jgi:hypothetical protein
VRLHGRGALAAGVAVVAIVVGAVGGGTATARGTAFKLASLDGPVYHLREAP